MPSGSSGYKQEQVWENRRKDLIWESNVKLYFMRLLLMKF